MNRSWILRAIVCCGLAGCGSETEKPAVSSRSFEPAADKEPSAEIEADSELFALQSSVGDEARQQAKSIPRGQATGVGGAFSGSEVEQSKGPPIVTIKIASKLPDGKILVRDSRSSTSERDGARFKFSGTLKAPDEPGEYLLQAWRNGRQFSETSVTVE